MDFEKDFDSILDFMLERVSKKVELPKVQKIWEEYRKSIGQKNPCPARSYEEAWSNASNEQKVSLLKRELPSSYLRKLDRELYRL